MNQTEGGDETAETSLTDELLDPSTPDPDQIVVDETDAGATERGVADDDDDYLELDHRRSRWTTGLVVSLIFVIGIFCGVLLTRWLSPTPPPQTVYLLNDAGSGSSAAPEPSRGSAPPLPSSRPSAAPRSR